MKPVIDLTGKSFGRLRVISYGGFVLQGVKKRVKVHRWNCICSCGRKAEVSGVNLRTGVTQSCGCLAVERNGARTHGKTKTPTHNSWRAMIERCYNKNNSHYKNYGGRGIVVYAPWRGSFEAFLLDMGERPPGKTLDRFPYNNGNYEPSNCRWAEKNEQIRNTTRTVFISWRGETLCRKDWAIRIGITDTALEYRLKKWGLEKAMTKERKGYGFPGGSKVGKETS